MTESRALKLAIVLWQVILLAALCSAIISPANAQVDTAGRDSLRRVAFSASSSAEPMAPFGRTIDVALTGGAGFNHRGSETPFQATANADFFARTNALDFTVGLHWGFSDPASKALMLGLRFPISEEADRSSGVYGDAGLLFTDDGLDSESFSTGFRAALAGRSMPFEYRAAVEFRRIPVSGGPFSMWAGVELGLVIGLLHEGATEFTLKDSLRNQLRYIATSGELDELDKASSNAEIDAWLTKFWQARNVTGTPRNEAREEFERRVRLANDRYGSPRRMGVTTDMGRVLLIYGEPDRVETATSLLGSDRKYTLWVYEERVRGYRTALVLFVNSVRENARGESHGDWRQVYSNIIGEPSEGIPVDVPSSMTNFIRSY